MTCLPSLDDYDLAIQNPACSLTVPELQVCQPTLRPLGVPESWTGGWAITFRLIHPSGDATALRCFHRPMDGLFERYQAFQAFCQTCVGPLKEFLVPSAFVEHGILVSGLRYPIVVMPWVQGDKLDEWVKAHADQPGTLTRLRKAFRKMIAEMAKEDFVHGDLQHGNLLVRQGRPVLVDYDGVFPPGADHLPFSLIGIPSFQHPAFSIADDPRRLDRFPSLVIHTALEALEQLPELGRVPGAFDDALLFHAEDFTDPSNSKLFRVLKGHPYLRRRAEALARCALGPVSAVPDLETFLRDSIQTLHSMEPELSAEKIRTLDRICAAATLPISAAAKTKVTARPKPPSSKKPATRAAKPAVPRPAAVPPPLAIAPPPRKAVLATVPAPQPVNIPAQGLPAKGWQAPAASPSPVLTLAAPPAPPTLHPVALTPAPISPLPPPPPPPVQQAPNPRPALIVPTPYRRQERGGWKLAAMASASMTLLGGGSVGISALWAWWKTPPLVFTPCYLVDPVVPRKRVLAPIPASEDLPAAADPQPAEEAPTTQEAGMPSAPPASSAAAAETIPAPPRPNQERKLRDLTPDEIRTLLLRIREVAEEDLLQEQRELERQLQLIETQMVVLDGMDPASRFELRDPAGKVTVVPPHVIAAHYRVQRAKTLAQIENLRLPLRRFDDLLREGPQRPDYLAAVLRTPWNLPPRARRMIEALQW